MASFIAILFPLRQSQHAAPPAGWAQQEGPAGPRGRPPSPAPTPHSKPLPPTPRRPLRSGRLPLRLTRREGHILPSRCCPGRAPRPYPGGRSSKRYRPRQKRRGPEAISRSRAACTFGGRADLDAQVRERPCAFRKGRLLQGQLQGRDSEIELAVPWLSLMRGDTKETFIKGDRPVYVRDVEREVCVLGTKPPFPGGRECQQQSLGGLPF